MVGAWLAHGWRTGRVDRLGSEAVHGRLVPLAHDPRTAGVVGKVRPGGPRSGGRRRATRRTIDVPQHSVASDALTMYSGCSRHALTTLTWAGVWGRYGRHAPTFPLVPRLVPPRPFARRVQPGSPPPCDQAIESRGLAIAVISHASGCGDPRPHPISPVTATGASSCRDGDPARPRPFVPRRPQASRQHFLGSMGRLANARLSRRSHGRYVLICARVRGRYVLICARVRGRVR